MARRRSVLVSAPPDGADSPSEAQVRLAFDGDAVLFHESSELVFQTHDLAAFPRLRTPKPPCRLWRDHSYSS
ncbi:5'-nucleotidase [Nannocystis pusilla]|uniref:5'-nucleotidase n=1 Tax=Nannocystis pusilla TaxID=889268 RepID=UPI003DA3742B